MKHAHASYANIILQLSLTHKIKFVPKPCTDALSLSLSPMGRERTPKKKVPPHCMQQTFWWCTQMLRCDIITLRVCTSLLGVCLLAMHMFLNFEILSSKCWTGFSFWAHHTGPSTRLFFWEKIIVHTWHVLVLGACSKSLSYQSGSGISSKADFLPGIYLRWTPVLLCNSSFLSFLRESRVLVLILFNANWRVFGQRVWAPFFSFKEPCSFGSHRFFPNSRTYWLVGSEHSPVLNVEVTNKFS